MQLQRLKIQNFRNLRNFEITFTGSTTNADGTEREFKSHAVIGQNGTGKSNMIEAIVTIFRDIDLNQPTEFSYELDYTCRGHRIQINAMEEKGTATITERGSDKSKKFALSYVSRKHGSGDDYVDNAKKFLPSHVFAYYSGRNERIEAIFQQHQQRFYDALIGGSDELMRRLFYCRTVHSQFVLLAYLLKDDEECHRILSDFNIEELDSVLFVLKRPYWFKPDMSEEVLINGDNRVWYARGIVQEFLDELWKVAVAPIDHTENRILDCRGRKEKQDLLYLFVPDKAALMQLTDKIGESARLFKYLESTYISDLIDEVRINVKHVDVEGNINFSQLSEGEQQLLTVLGLMRFTQEDQSLFLLDEPDTHLNPIWKLRFFDEIERVVKLQDQTATGDSQLIIATHDPMMIGSLRKEQVRILKSQGGTTTVEESDENPQGMGVAGLLKSKLFGLPSTLDSDTLEKLQKRNELLAKEKKGALSDLDGTELKKLRSYLEDLGFTKEYRDPLYKLFIEKMYDARSQPLDRVLSTDELKEQESLAEEITRILVKRERISDLSSLAQELGIDLKR